MATSWPQGVDAFPTWTNGVDLINASIVNNVQDSVGAVQAEIERTYRPDLKPASPSAYDDEFETGVLDVKWTPVNCALGTVDLLTTAAAADTYDPATYRGMMALQPGRDDAGAGGPEAEAAMLRQTVTLGTNCKVIVKLNYGLTADMAGAGYGMAGIMLSGTNGFIDNDFFFVGLVGVGPGGGNGLARVGGGAPIGMGQFALPTNTIYVMLSKTGNDLAGWLGDGHSWGAVTDGGAPDNIQITFGAGVMIRLTLVNYWVPAAAEVNLPNPIATFDFARYFANNTPVVNA